MEEQNGKNEAETSQIKKYTLNFKSSVPSFLFDREINKIIEGLASENMIGKCGNLLQIYFFHHGPNFPTASLSENLFGNLLQICLQESTNKNKQFATLTTISNCLVWLFNPDGFEFVTDINLPNIAEVRKDLEKLVKSTVAEKNPDLFDLILEAEFTLGILDLISNTSIRKNIMSGYLSVRQSVKKPINEQQVILSTFFDTLTESFKDAMTVKKKQISCLPYILIMRLLGKDVINSTSEESSLEDNFNLLKTFILSNKKKSLEMVFTSTHVLLAIARLCEEEQIRVLAINELISLSDYSEYFITFGKGFKNQWVRVGVVESLIVLSDLYSSGSGIPTNVLDRVSKIFTEREKVEKKPNLKDLLEKRSDPEVVSALKSKHLVTSCDLSFEYEFNNDGKAIHAVEDSILLYSSDPSHFLPLIRQQLKDFFFTLTDSCTLLTAALSNEDISAEGKGHLLSTFFEVFKTNVTAAESQLNADDASFLSVLVLFMLGIVRKDLFSFAQHPKTSLFTETFLSVSTWVLHHPKVWACYYDDIFLYEGSDATYHTLAEWIIRSVHRASPKASYSTKFAEFLTSYPKYREWVLVPGFFPTESEIVLAAARDITHISVDLITLLQHYGKLHLPDYQAFIRQMLPSSEKFVLKLAYLCSNIWTNTNEMQLISTLSRQTEEKLKTESCCKLLDLMGHAAGLKFEVAKEVLNIILNLEEVETESTSTTKELSLLLEREPWQEWTEHLRNLTGKLLQLKYPEKPIEKVLSEFRSRPYPLKDELLEKTASVYAEIMDLFYKENMHRLTREDLSARVARQLRPWKDKSSREFLVNMLAVIRQGVFLEKGYYPFNTQVLTVLGILIYPGRGCLAEVKTGQGKSVIIAMLSTFLSIRGFKIDVITTATSLAMRDSKEMSHFFRLFGITTCHIISSSPTHTENYAADVVYGTPFYFEYHAILDEYDQCAIRKPRDYQVALIDEVDSMMIDQVSHCTRIIYQDKLFWEVSWVYPLIAKLISNNPHCSTEEIVNLFRETEELHTCSVYTKNFITTYLPYWVSAMFDASGFVCDVEYTVQDGVVKPVNNRSTGEIRQNTFYVSGKHQYLEVRNGLYPSLDRQIGANLSHLTFFKRYQHIFGLSGTMGSAEERGEILHFYQLHTFDVPVHAEGRREIIPPQLTYGQAPFLKGLVEEIVEVHRTKRPVLVLMGSIRDTLLLGRQLAVAGISHEVLNGKQQKLEEQIIAESGQPGSITVATNLASRGTDIRTNAATEALGGLHLIIAFPPVNTRVDNQARGRTARQGKQGTVKYHVNKEVLTDEGMKSVCSDEFMEAMAAVMRRQESYQSHKRKSIFAPGSEFLDQLFFDICGVLRSLVGSCSSAELKGLKKQWVKWYSLIQAQTDYLQRGNGDPVALHRFIEEKAKEGKKVLKEIEKNGKAKRFHMDVSPILEALSGNDHQNIINECSRALKLDSKSVGAHLKLVLAYKASGNSRKTEERMKATEILCLEKLGRFNEDLIALTGLYLINILRGRSQEATHYLGKSKDILKSKGSTILNCIGDLYLDGDSIVEIVLHHMKQRKTCDQFLPRDIEPMLYTLSKDSKSHKVGLKLAQIASNANPSCVSFLNYIGYFHKELNNLELAVVYLKKALEIDPTYSYANENLAWTYVKIALNHEKNYNYRAALENSLLANQYLPNNEIINNNIGLFYARLGNKGKALSYYNLALKINPNYKKAIENKRNLN